MKMCVDVCGCVRTCVWPGTCARRKGSFFDEASKKFIYHMRKKMSDQNMRYACVCVGGGFLFPSAHTQAFQGTWLQEPFSEKHAHSGLLKAGAVSHSFPNPLTPGHLSTLYIQ